ncbi:DUF1223 domain-containing protein [Pseudomonas lalucatii]|uniref:DUF1223 domain-containing protein n=1 Tax=Pseudomonas lalucatii TaxID=1424203 RepID=A0ABS5PWK8_9PSED|nr:DUF1223 domain-containing protein [Pseudomonas lalucatii]MBS7660466.1 DUF1223 domain-containing protein [Pseudomonas lalucatii]
MRKPPLALPLALLLCSLLARAEDGLHISSGVSATAVLELYTAQGCSSCPPADRWLSALREHPALWHGLIPLAFHVDYWDRLGWPDPFANPEHSARQRGYARAGASRGVYTPAFILAGREWHGWFRDQPLRLPCATEVGNLSLRLEGDSLQLSFAPSRPAPPGLIAHVARLGFGLRTEVQRGENAGKRLGHDFVVLSLQRIAPDMANRWQTRLHRDRRGERQAVVAWLSAPGRLPPYQAVGGWLPASAELDSH